MMQKTWFKLFIWFVSSFMFYMASGLVISFFGPEATETQIMAYMNGMMNAMESLMGQSMTLEADPLLSKAISFASSFTFVLIILGIAGADYVRLTRRKRNG